MSSLPPCLGLLRLGECSNLEDDCPFDHDLSFCATCDTYFESMDQLSEHLEEDEHVARLGTANVEAVQLSSGKIRCKPCHAEIDQQDWSRHSTSASHALKVRYNRYKDAKAAAEADKGDVKVTPAGDLEFGLVEFAEFSSSTVDKQRVQPLVIEAHKKLTLEGARFKEKIPGNPPRHFSVQKLPQPQSLKPGRPFNLMVHFLPRNTIGSHEEILLLEFKAVDSKGVASCFTIQRTVTGSVGVKDDLDAFSSQTPYSPPDLKNRPPRAQKKDTVRAPRIKSKGNINWTVSLPYFVMPPPRLVQMLENTPIPKILRQLRKYPGELMYHRYQIFWKTLLQIEAHQEDLNIRRYDIDNTTLQLRSNGFYHLDVPGLAEKRPSVTVNDLVKVQVRGSNDKRWFEGLVVTIESTRVGIRFKSSFDPSAGSKFDVQFHINRLPIRRQLQALEFPLPRPDLLFPNLGTRYNGYPVADQHPPFFHQAIEANFCQRQAVLSIFYGASGSAPYIVFGPPGTGKTVTIIETCLQLLQYLDATILLTAPSNAAADLLCTRLNLDETVVLRLNAPTRKFDDVAPGILEFSYTEDGHFGCPPLEELKQYKVIVSTCISAGILRGVGLETGHFTHIFVDEAGQSTEPETLIPASFASRDTNLILAGDPKQLGPILQSAITRQLGLETSMLERIMANPLYHHDNFAYRGVTYTKLVQNYRNHPAILATPNQEFYSNELLPCAPLNVITSLQGWEGWPNRDFPIIFHSIKGRDERDGVDPSFFNVAEISTVKQYVHSLTTSQNIRCLDSDIGVISPYAAQCAKLRVALQQNARPNLTVGTVEQFQGSERSVILLSTVRSNKEFLEQDKRFAIGFLGNEKRFNVAITRPQAGLIIVGDPEVLTLDPLWRRFLVYIHDSGGWQGQEWDPTPFKDPTFDPAQAARQEMDDVVERFGTSINFDNDS